MAASPASSPRLPSPPPMAEDQIGPKSPTAAIMDQHGRLDFPANFSQGASRRIRPGTKAADMPEGPPLMELTEIDSPFQLTEHLKALYNAAIHPTSSDVVVPIDRPTAIRLSQPPDGVDRALWLYELCRFLCQKVNSIIIALFADNPPCSAQTCNEMRASEWQYLCAVHDPPKPCCAIDYCCHTLDWAANTLTSPKQFPSRLALGTETNSAHQQLRQLTNIFRRVYRIFAHAWFQHREMFWKVEGQTGLYIFFKTVCDVYGLIPEENYTVPPEAEGMESTPKEHQEPIRRPTVLRKNERDHPPAAPPESSAPEIAGNVTTATGHTTKRHRHVPSTDAASITTVVEEAEEEEKAQQPTAEDSAAPESQPTAEHDKPEEVDLATSEHRIEIDRGTEEPITAPTETEPAQEPLSENAESSAQPSEPAPTAEADAPEAPPAEAKQENLAPTSEPEPTEPVAAPAEEGPEEPSEGSSAGQHTPPESETGDHPAETPAKTEKAEVMPAVLGEEEAKEESKEPKPESEPESEPEAKKEE